MKEAEKNHSFTAYQLLQYLSYQPEGTQTFTCMKNTLRKAPSSPPATATIINFIISLGFGEATTTPPPLKTSQHQRNSELYIGINQTLNNLRDMETTVNELMETIPFNLIC
jgi:hypothetical protein